MFNKKLKQRIKDLEERMDEEDEKPRADKDFFTKNVHYKEDMVVIQGVKEYELHYMFSHFPFKEWEPKRFYFLKGTEPKCDYIREYVDGKIEFIKNQVLCDKKGEIIRKIVK